MVVALGYRWPCRTEGIYVNLEEVEPQAGEIVELYFESDKDIVPQEAIKVVTEIALVKEEYPSSVIHYINIEPRRITIQYSVAPPGGHASPANWYAIYWIIALIIIGIVVVYAVKRGYIFAPKTPTGRLSISAISCGDEQCSHPYGLNVDFSIAGKTYSTEGGTVDIELTVGEYQLIPFDEEGYQTPIPQRITIVADKAKSVELRYFEDGVTPPTTGWLITDTYPVKGMVYVNATELGKAPQQVEVDVGDYVVSFGDIKGYETPQSETCTVGGGQRVPITGKYESVGWPIWAKVVAIGGGTIAAALIVPPLIRRLPKGEKEVRK